MTENNLEKKKSSKELWLVLIFVDIIALCIFSYFIYSSFANSTKKSVQINRNPKTEEIVLEEIDLRETVKETKKEIPQEINKEQTDKKNQVKEDSKPSQTKEQKEISEPTLVTKQEERESFNVSGTGKWRKVTFRYFDDAKSVAIISGFTMRKQSPLKKVKGIWETTLTIAPGTYNYMFVVDGNEVKDPYNKQENNGRSVINIK